MRAIIIDAKERKVYEKDVDGGLDAMQAVVGGYIELASTFANGDDLYVNEEGLLHGEDNFFFIEGLHQPMAGNGLILGHDDEGDTQPAKSKVADLKVTFMTRQDIIAGLPGRGKTKF